MCSEAESTLRWWRWKMWKMEQVCVCPAALALDTSCAFMQPSEHLHHFTWTSALLSYPNASFVWDTEVYLAITFRCSWNCTVLAVGYESGILLTVWVEHHTCTEFQTGCSLQPHEWPFDVSYSVMVGRCVKLQKSSKSNNRHLLKCLAKVFMPLISLVSNYSLVLSEIKKINLSDACN